MKLKKIIFILFIVPEYFLCSSQNVNDYYARAKVKWSQGKFREGISDMNKFIKNYPSDTAYDFRAQLKYQCRDYRGAVDDYTLAIACTKKDSVHLICARASVKGQFDVEGAVKDYSIAIKLDPKFGGYYYRGDLFLSLKRYKEAIEDYNHQIALHLAKSSISYYPYLQKGVAEYRLSDFKSALSDLDSALYYEPNCIFCFEFKAKIKRDLGMKGDACEDYIKAANAGYKEFDTLIQKYCKK